MDEAGLMSKSAKGLGRSAKPRTMANLVISTSRRKLILPSSVSDTQKTLSQFEKKCRTELQAKNYGVWKLLQRERGKITPEMCQCVFLAWKKRCRTVAQERFRDLMGLIPIRASSVGPNLRPTLNANSCGENCWGVILETTTLAAKRRHVFPTAMGLIPPVFFFNAVKDAP
ncbi:hypothetical protein Fcan01_28175 [Folsomia candida]|uniref:Uncharacterized protein n=1 Tax=Folsomia candida TaxID=158441 RepID=A0A226CUH9_FOLCA|nr:hypothetical protein Fcan01_28175 [Folsomia candida]